MRVRSDGSIEVKLTGWPVAKAVRIPRVKLEAVISTGGANGDVFSGTHRQSEKPVAVKLWYRKRPSDSRDKLDQGVSEMIRTSRYPAAVDIIDGGVVGGMPFCIMELVEGVTLKEWVQAPDITLAAKCYMALQILHIDAAARSMGQHHGDLHTGNILAVKSDDHLAHERSLATHQNPNHDRGFFLPVPRIIDAGTSRFTPARRHQIRHWTTLMETVNRLVAPIRVDLMMADTIPDGVVIAKGRVKLIPKDESVLKVWLESALQEIAMFVTVGLGFDAPAPIFGLIGDLEAMYPEGSSMRIEADRLRSLSHGLTEASVGSMVEWQTYPKQMWTGP